MIIDKTIAACNVCSNSWFCKKDGQGELMLPKKCPACTSPNWNKTDIRKYRKSEKMKTSVVILDKSVEFINGKKRFTLAGEEKRD